MSDVGTGLNEGAQFGQAIIAGHVARQQRKLDTASREATAGAIPGSPQAPAEDGGGFHPIDAMKDVVGKFYNKLRGRTLNDAHVANDDAEAAAAIPPAAPTTGPDGAPIPVEQGTTLAATQAAATDPAANAGVPQESAQKSKKHSMTREDDDELDDHILQATRAAALAGHDPGEVFKSLNAIKTAHYQGNILKNLNAAGVALQRGDSKAVEQALKNVYYYFPNGDELNMKHDADGRVLYQDPFNPQKEDGSDNYIPVDAAHLQMLGLAAIDSTKLNDAIVGAKTASIERALKVAQGEAATKNANSAAIQADAAKLTAEGKNKLIPSQIYANVAKGGYDEARANIDELRLKLALARGTSGLPKGAQVAANDAASYVYAQFQGQPQTVPVTDDKGNPNLSPAAGKTIRDPKLVPSYLKGKTPDQLPEIAATAGAIAAANFGSMSKDEAVSLAARLVDARGKTHPTTEGSGFGADLMVSKDGTAAQLWQGKSSDGKDLGYRTFKLAPQFGTVLVGGGELLPSGADKEGGDPSLGEGDEDPGYDPNDPNDDPSYHIPAIPAQE